MELILIGFLSVSQKIMIRLRNPKEDGKEII